MRLEIFGFVVEVYRKSNQKSVAKKVKMRDLELSVRTESALKRHGLLDVTLNDFVLQYSQFSFLRMRNVGRKSVEELRDHFLKKQLTWREQ